MDESVKQFTKDMKLNPPSTAKQLNDAGLILGINFPDQYKEFMLNSNGAEGGIGKNSYLAIWAAENIAQYNADYEVNEFNPGLVYFGSDGGGMVFAFDNRTPETPIVTLPFESVDLEDLELCAHSFNEFLQGLYNAD